MQRVRPHLYHRRPIVTGGQRIAPVGVVPERCPKCDAYPWAEHRQSVDGQPFDEISCLYCGYRSYSA